MKKLILILIIQSVLFSCKPFQSKALIENQITYSAYREQQKSFDSKDGAIKYIDKGSGDVIVLLHGIPTSGWLYRKMIDELSKTHRVIVPDMLGFGSSDSPKGYAIYSEDKHAERLLALMDYLSITTWTHVMHDAGGLWTWELFKKEPNRINKLIILNTIIYEDGFKPPIRFKPGFVAKTAMWSYRNGITTNLMLNKLFKEGLTKNTLNKIDVEGYKKPLKEGKTRGMYYFFSKTCNDLTNYNAIVSKIKIPIAVIWGENDSFLSWSAQSKTVSKDLNISMENIHILDAKHFIQEEQPNIITKIILDF
ncbi:alpha/beta hydrolase [Lacinutrix sp.]|uniref:alpha/beta fold hydrolase n=1 Tax=Lacinutrix sp. TaxID=1937692 RepID=UPI0025BEAD85|nr:alpha/beta hydrolase [Lacinutrix sp.]